MEMAVDHKKTRMEKIDLDRKRQTSNIWAKLKDGEFVA